MRKEEINKVIGMLDDDVIADALGEKKKRAPRFNFKTALIAAALAVAMIVGVSAAAMLRKSDPSENRLPPEGAHIIRNTVASAQLTPTTVYASGNYFSPATQFTGALGERYVVVNDIEIDGELFDALVASNDPNCTWAVEVSISPNLYMSSEYIEKEAAYWMAQCDATDLGAIYGIYEQLSGNIDVNALYEQYKDVYDIDMLYKYFASGELEEDILNADIVALKNKAEELWNECDGFKADYWRNIRPGVLEVLNVMDIDYISGSGNSIIVFLTEGQILGLEGLSGVKLSKAGQYYITAGITVPMQERFGKLVTRDLAQALDDNAENKKAYIAVGVEPAAYRKALDRANYEKEYLEKFAELAKLTSNRLLIEAAATDFEKYAQAVRTLGADVVNKYIVDSVFNSALFEEDTSALQYKVDEMRGNLYGFATKYVERSASRIRYYEIGEGGTLTIYVTVEEFEALKVSGDYCYKLAS